mmetsp:Transcript_97724/g.271903  ORF Transcript_97724/g.271903 Transcript_97724/m.271903 type:complete len:437 (+) Transcript_97724:231-1541(+)
MRLGTSRAAPASQGWKQTLPAPAVAVAAAAGRCRALRVRCSRALRASALELPHADLHDAEVVLARVQALEARHVALADHLKVLFEHVRQHAQGVHVLAVHLEAAQPRGAGRHVRAPVVVGADDQQAAGRHDLVHGREQVERLREALHDAVGDHHAVRAVHLDVLRQLRRVAEPEAAPAAADALGHLGELRGGQHALVHALVQLLAVVHHEARVSDERLALVNAHHGAEGARQLEGHAAHAAAQVQHLGVREVGHGGGAGRAGSGSAGTGAAGGGGRGPVCGVGGCQRLAQLGGVLGRQRQRHDRGLVGHQLARAREGRVHVDAQAAHALPKVGHRGGARVRLGRHARVGHVAEAQGLEEVAAEGEAREVAGLVARADPGAAGHHGVPAVEAGRAEVIVQVVDLEVGQRREVVLDPLPHVAVRVVDAGLGGLEHVDG